MLNFIGMTFSIAGGILLAMFAMFMIMLQPKVMKFYAKAMLKQIESFSEITDEENKDQ